MRSPVALLAALTLCHSGCGDTQAEGGGGSAGTTTGVNEPPAWSDAPTEAVAIGQGRSLLLPTTIVDPEGDVVTVGTTVPAGPIEAEVSTDPPGIAIHAGYAAAGAASLEVAISDAAGASVTTPVALQVEPILWHERQTWTEAAGPEAREHGALIVDEAGGRVLLFGGSGYSPYLDPLDDLWQYDPASGAWSELTASGTIPSGGGSRRVATVPGQRLAYLFGGYGANGANHAELYRVSYDGEVAFELVEQQGTPPKRALHAFVYDAPADRFVLFGGAGFKPFDDTWTMKLEGGIAVWTELELPVSPSGRYGFFYGHDTERGRLVVFSGAQGFDPLEPARDVWALDLRSEPPSWQLLLEGEASGVPEGRRNGCAVFDPSGPRLFVFGGTPDAQTSAEGLFALDVRPGKESFTELVLDGEPPVRSSGFGFHDAAGGRVLLGFGNTSSAVFRDWGVIGY